MIGPLGKMNGSQSWSTNKVTAPLRGRAFKHIFLIGLMRRMRETGEICAFRSSNAVKRVREAPEAVRNFSDFFAFYNAFSTISKDFLLGELSLVEVS